ncbi:MAG: MTAP family purine nucleoside phosphorylase [Thermomicrobiales bacterium]|nr:MTAP family purine nucleoside phosphorylase [Thermomicrobiales bacterium]
MTHAIIGGTGFTDMTFLEAPRALVVRTPFGGMTAYSGGYAGQELIFVPRHGPQHNALAHQVNYKANIWGLRELGVERIVGVSAIGSLNPQIEPGDLVLMDQLVDFTKHRDATFNLGSVNFRNPYCDSVRAVALEQARALGQALHPQATYLAVEGPRYGTAAERKLWIQWGMDVIGMTNGTEAALARELGLCYAVIGLVSDGGSGARKVASDLDAHRRVVEENLAKLRALTLATVAALPQTRDCPCASLAATGRG